MRLVCPDVCSQHMMIVVQYTSLIEKCLVSLYCTMNNKCLYKHVKCFHSRCNLHDTASNCTDSAVGKAGVIFASVLSLTAGLAAVLLAEQIVEANLVMLNLEPMGSSVYCIEVRLPHLRGSCTQYTCPGTQYVCLWSGQYQHTSIEAHMYANTCITVYDN